MTRWPEDEIGSSSVKPWTTPRTNACQSDSAPLRSPTPAAARTIAAKRAAPAASTSPARRTSDHATEREAGSLPQPATGLETGAARHASRRLSPRGTAWFSLASPPPGRDARRRKQGSKRFSADGLRPARTVGNEIVAKCNLFGGGGGGKEFVWGLN